MPPETLPRQPDTKALTAALAAERASFIRSENVSRETLERLDRFVSLLVTWQRKTNLVAPSTLSTLWTRHIADSLQFQRLSPSPKTWVDLGSGGGFPGLVTAILQAEHGGGAVHLVESNDKKAAFLRAVIRECDLAARVHAQRIEACAALLGRAEAVSARALAPLTILLGFVAGRIPAAIPCYFAKGRGHEEEIVDASHQWRFTMIEHVSAIAAGSVILEIRDITPREGPKG